MKRYVIAALCVMSIMVAHAQGTKYELSVGDFSELKVSNGVNVDYKCNPDSAGSVVFTATADKASVLMFSNNKNRLEVQISTDGIKYNNLPTVTVYSRFLTKVENSGDSLVRVLSSSSGPNFKARLVGNGRLVVRDVDAVQVDASINTGNGLLVLYGKCSSAKFNNTGTGNIQADELLSSKAKCVQVGTGSIGCSVSDELTIYGASGKVYYHGNPIVKNRSIGVKVLPLDNEE